MAIIRMAGLLLLATWVSGQTVQAQIPALRLQAANYNATSGLWTNTVGPNAQAGGTFPTLSTGVSPNGSAAVVFNGANYLTLASSIPSSTPYTVFAYIKPATGAGPYALFGGATGSFECRIYNSKQDSLRQAQADLGSETTAMSTSAFSIINNILTGSGVSFRLNGVADGTNTASSGLTQPISAIGARASATGNENYSGSICEIAIFTNVLTAVQITNIENALTATYVSSSSAPVIYSDTTVSPSTNVVGANESIYASFAGSSPISYQWQFSTNSSGANAVNISGATSTTLSLVNLQLTNSGYYSLKATNTVSPFSANSSWVQLTVQPLTPMVQYQSTNYNATSGVWADSSGNGNNATYSGGTKPTLVSVATPNGSSAVSFTATSQYFSLASSLSPSSGYTVFAFIKPSVTSGRNALTGGSNGGGNALEYDFYSGKQNYLIEYVGGGGSGTATISTSSFSSINLAVNSSGGAFRLNGASDGTVAGATFSQPITRIGGNTGAGDNLYGQVAEIDIYSGVLTAYQITNVEAQLTAKYVTANSVVVGPATVSPTNNIYAGTAVTLAASVIGATGTTGYQWQTDNGSGGASFANISGATTTNYVLTTTSLTPNTYQYQLVVSPFGGGAVTSAPVTLTVQAASAPVVIADIAPNPAAATVGGNLTFSAGFAGNSTISYQWQISPNADGSGATSLTAQTNTTLVLTNLQLSDSGKYYSLQASNAVAPYTNSSSWAQLTVTPLSPVLQLKAANYNPSSGLWTATIGANAQATGTYPTLATGVTSNGSPAVVFNGANKLQLATSIPATNSYTVFAYTMPSTSTGNLALIGGAAGAFEYRISNGKQDALKQATTDLGFSTTALSTNTFSIIDATVSGSGGAFRLNGVADGTNAGSSFTADISSIGARDTGTGENFSGQIVEIDIYNGELSPTQISTIETALTNAYFNPLAPAIVTDTIASPSTATIGGNDTLSASFSGNLPISYQWQVANNSSGTGATSLTGQTNTTLVLTNLQLSDSGKYYSLRASNNVSPYTANSSWLQLNVVALTPALQLLATNYDAGSGVWTDSSGNGNNATYSGGTTPTLVTSVTPNGGSAVDIASTGGSFLLTSALSQTNGGYTVFTYVKPTTVNSGSSRFAITGGSAAGALEYNFYQGNQNYLIEYTGGGGGGTATIPTSSFSMLSLAVNASGANFRLNGADDGTVAGATFTQPITRIGNNHGFGDSLVGQVAEVDVYNGVLTTAQITNIEAQLTAKYITSTVATNPTNITASVSGNTLTLTWPGDHLGWTLQTNATDLANSSDWFAYPGSASVTNVSVTINPNQTNVFFRLISP